jgi:NAD(P)-dependent dehydrogenase (short-subunit alcohol dehydrogenase family)
VPDPTSRVAVVTGASSGIGAELVRTLRAQGWLTVGVSRRPSGADEHEECDVGERVAVEALAARVLARHERIDLLVNNAGFTAGVVFVRWRSSSRRAGSPCTP